MAIQLGIAGGDVAGHALVEAALGEQAEAGGQALLAVETLLLNRIERRRRGDQHGGRKGRHEQERYRRRVASSSWHSGAPRSWPRSGRRRTIPSCSRAS